MAHSQVIRLSRCDFMFQRIIVITVKSITLISREDKLTETNL